MTLALAYQLVAACWPSLRCCESSWYGSLGKRGRGRGRGDGETSDGDLQKKKAPRDRNDAGPIVTRSRAPPQLIRTFRRLDMWRLKLIETSFRIEWCDCAQSCLPNYRITCLWPFIGMRCKSPVPPCFLVGYSAFPSSLEVR